MVRRKGSVVKKINRKGINVAKIMNKLPVKSIIEMSFSERVQPCPTCGTASKRHQQNFFRTVHTLPCRNDLNGKPIPAFLLIHYAKYHCLHCHKYFSHDLSDIVLPGSNFSNELRQHVIELYYESSLRLEKFCQELKKQGIYLAHTTFHDMLRVGIPKIKKAKGTPEVSPSVVSPLSAIAV